jgi:hypothetical protein
MKINIQKDWGEFEGARMFFTRLVFELLSQPIKIRRELLASV